VNSHLLATKLRPPAAPPKRILRPLLLRRLNEGLAANGLDLLHVFAGLALPQVATTMLWIAGVFYLAWFPLLALDLLKRGQA
jgi:hypothetical protein